jgi:hypothetical protein
MERITYSIDQSDVITGVADDWVSFAQANAAAHLIDDVVGRSLWDFVSGVTTRHVYRELLAHIRAGRTITFGYRCDSPDLRRFMQMTMACGANGVVTFDSVNVRTERRVPPLRTLVSGKATDPGLAMCSWCKRVDVSGAWEEVEVAIQRLGLFAEIDAPLITHAMCPTCYQEMMASVNEA